MAVISDIDSIKDYLSGDIDTIMKILTQSGYYNLKYEEYTKDIRGGHSPTSNNTSLQVNTDTLVSSLHSKGVYGDLFTVLEYKLGDFITSLNLVKQVANISYNEYEFKKDNSLAWGCWWEDINICDKIEELKTYDKRLLEQFKNVGNEMFRKDNIDLGTQSMFNIGFDFKTQRVTIPHYSIDGELIGVVGRLNQGARGNAKYLPLIPRRQFPRKHVLFGAYQNKKNIKGNPLIIFESEKSVMQSYSYGLTNTVALGGKRIYSEQMISIEKLAPSSIILALDEDVEEEYVQSQCKKIEQYNVLNSVPIYYIFDHNNQYLKKGSKLSPSDLGKETLQELVLNRLVRYKGVNSI